MYTISTISSLLALSLASTQVNALGVNCRGSGLCPLAAFENTATVSVVQVLRDAIHHSKKPDSTVYKNGDHIICISESLHVTVDASAGYGPASGGIGLSGKIGSGGVCAFAQSLKTGSITLGAIRTLADKVVDHGCTACGSVPVDFAKNDPRDGILTFNYAGTPTCTGNCISAAGKSAKFRME